MGHVAPSLIQEYTAWKARHGYGLVEEIQEDSDLEFGEGSGESEEASSSFDDTSAEESSEEVPPAINVIRAT